MEHHHFDQCIMIINSQVITGQTKVIPAYMWAVLQALNVPWGCTAESLRLWTCSRQFTRICDPVPDNEQKKKCTYFLLSCICLCLCQVLPWDALSLIENTVEPLHYGHLGDRRNRCGREV